MRYLYATDCEHCEGGCRGSFTANCPRQARWVEEGEHDLPEHEMRELAAKNPNGLAAAAVQVADMLPRLSKFRGARGKLIKVRYTYVECCHHCPDCTGPLTEQCPRSAWWSEEAHPETDEWQGCTEAYTRHDARIWPGSTSDAIVRAADGQPRLKKVDEKYYRLTDI